ncbi:MAG: ABC transporter ATP-binding protein, partial [Opitutaceae bacterium]
EMLGRPKAEVAARVAEMLKLVRMEDLKNRRTSQISGGQQQRVALARALAPQPKVLLLDEPLSALDARLRETMQLELKRLQRQVNTTFIFVTHDQAEALAMSDRIALINRGRIEQIGEAAEIYHRPATAFAAEFIGNANLLEAELIAVENDIARIRVAGTLELRLPASRWPAGATRAKISIRPEKIHLSRLPPPGENSFAARVIEKTFKGPTDALVLQILTGPRLHALLTNASASTATCAVGDSVWCALSSGDIGVVP